MNSKMHIFIGSGEANAVETAVLIHSIKSRTKQPVEIAVFNGTHNTIEYEDGSYLPANLSLTLKRMGLTDFSLYRFLVPHCMGFKGKALWLDSDILVLGDVSELFSVPLEGASFLARSDPRKGFGWNLGVMLFDCERCRFPIGSWEDQLRRKEIGYYDLMQMKPQFQTRNSIQIGELPTAWHQIDSAPAGTKLVHFSALESQPWRYPGHPLESQWRYQFERTVKESFLTEADLMVARLRGGLRRDLVPAQTQTALEQVERWMERRVAMPLRPERAAS